MIQQLFAHKDFRTVLSDSVAFGNHRERRERRGGGLLILWRGLADHRFGDLRSFALEENADLASRSIRRETAQIATGLPSSPAHWQEKYNEAHDVSPPGSTTVNSVRLTCADSTLDVCSR